MKPVVLTSLFFSFEIWSLTEPGSLQLGLVDRMVSKSQDLPVSIPQHWDFRCRPLDCYTDVGTLPSGPHAISLAPFLLFLLTFFTLKGPVLSPMEAYSNTIPNH